VVNWILSPMLIQLVPNDIHGLHFCTREGSVADRWPRLEPEIHAT
jgi:hypothetical protein